jgi:hypothetical protein
MACVTENRTRMAGKGPLCLPIRRSITPESPLILHAPKVVQLGEDIPSSIPLSGGAPTVCLQHPDSAPGLFRIQPQTPDRTVSSRLRRDQGEPEDVLPNGVLAAVFQSNVTRTGNDITFSGVRSSVSGGDLDTARGVEASVSGGYHNTTTTSKVVRD